MAYYHPKPAPGRHFLQIPGPTNVPDRVLRAIDNPTMDHRGPEFGRMAKALLEKLRAVFQTKGPVVIYPASGTGAWEAALANTLSPGDRVLMCETGWFATLWKEMADRLGIKSLGMDPSLYGPSLTLGGRDVTPMELTAAYGAFANGGRKVTPTLISKVTDSSGNVLYQAPLTPGEQVLEPCVLVFDLAQAPSIADFHAAVFLLPAVVGLLRDTVLAAELEHGDPRLGFLQHTDDLFFAEPTSSHSTSPLPRLSGLANRWNAGLSGEHVSRTRTL